MYICPCCGHEVSENTPGSEICPICFWEEDAFQLFFPLAPQGANRCSLAEAQVAFVQFGACDRSACEEVRPPGPNDKKDPLWFALWERPVALPDHETEADSFPLRASSAYSAPPSTQELRYWLRAPKNQASQ